MRLSLLAGMILWAVTLACGGHKAPTAIIHVVAWNTVAPMNNENALTLQREILTSDPFLQHVSQKFELPKVWSIDEAAAVARLRDALDVRLGTAPSTFAISTPGLERDLAVKVVNELCDYYVRETLRGASGKGLSRLQVTIQARAE